MVDVFFKSRFSSEYRIIYPFLQAIGNILTYDYTIEYVLSTNIFQIIHRTINSNNSELRKLSCWILGNMVNANLITFAHQVVEADFIRSVTELISKENTYDVMYEAFLFLGSLSSFCEFEFINKLIDYGYYDAIIVFLMNKKETTCCKIILEILINVFNTDDRDNRFVNRFSELGGMDLLEGLANHSHSDVSEYASHILNKFFSHI